MHVKKGDTVLVIAGNDRGKTGEIKNVLPKKQRVLVEGVNMRWHHQRPTQQNPKGERVEREVPIHVSNVKRVEAQAAPAKKAAKKKKATKKATKKKTTTAEGGE